MENIQISEAEERDLDEIAALSYQVGKMHDEALKDYYLPTSPGRHREIMRDMLNSKDMFILKAVAANKIRGFICMRIQETPRRGYVYAKTGEFYNFGVDEMYRGRGIGAQLLQAAEDFLRRKGAETVDLNVFCFNRRALKFYLAHDYQELEINMRKVLK